MAVFSVIGKARVEGLFKPRGWRSATINLKTKIKK